MCYIIIAAIVGFVALKKYRQWVFLSFLLFALYRYALKFPDLANHSNLNFFIYLLMLPVQLKVTLFHKDSGFSDLIKSFRISIIMLYFFTIFHKLNWDFLNPESSCANAKLRDYLNLIPDSLPGVQRLAQVLNPYLGWIVEGIIPVCLFFKNYRNFGILFVVVLHFVLAPMGFTDFSSLAMAFAWTFVDPQKIKSETAWKHFQWLVVGCLLMEVSFAPWRFPRGVEAYEFSEGVLFALLYSPFLLIHVGRHIDVEPLRWPRFWSYHAFLILLFVFGFSNYLGLRTAGTFSMFSNLTTEGKTSNHILLGSNPFKIWGFQEDTVEVVFADPPVEGFYRHMPYAKQKIPVIEFSRLLDKVKDRRSMIAPMQVIYNKKSYYTEDAGFDKEFREIFEVPWWQKKLMKFRFIQPSPPQYCHW